MLEACHKVANLQFLLKAATPALTIFFGAAPYEENGEMHERFWASHLNRVAMTGILVGAREQGEWIGFRAFFEPGKSRQPYTSDFVSVSSFFEYLHLLLKQRLQDNEGWDRFLELTNEASYMARIKEWGEKTGQTNVENGLTPAEYYTTSILVVKYVAFSFVRQKYQHRFSPRFQRRGVGSLLDNYTLNTVRCRCTHQRPLVQL